MFFPQKNIYLLLVLVLQFPKSLNGITIDNELQVIKNDCYERMAIGQRLGAKSVYKTSHVKTVAECQQECTKEHELCKSLSFGVGVKGNTTCELSNDPIKETADLKPIGTRSETDFDLYIKKLGCTLVITTNKPNIKPVHEDNPQPSLKPVQIGYGPQQVNNNNQNNGNSIISYGPESKPPSVPSYGNNVEHVQTVVSVSSGPQKPILHPNLEILVGEDTYNYGRPHYNRPEYSHNDNYRPFQTDRYDMVHRPIPERYGSYIPRPEDYDRPRPDDYYFNRPNHFYERPSLDRPDWGDYGGRPRPDPPGYRPRPPIDSDFYQNRPNLQNGYDNRPDRYDNRPNPDGGYNSRPIFENEYGLGPQKPNNYDSGRPTRPNNYDSRPNPQNSYDSRPNPPNNYENRPNPQNSYDSRPNPPNNYDSRPNNYENRPNPPSGYDSRPNTSGLTSDYGSEKPKPPNNQNSRPNNYDLQSNSPNNYDLRPNPPSDYHSKPDKPQSDGYNSKPKPSNDYLFNNNPNSENYGGGKPSRPKPIDSTGSYTNNVNHQNQKPIVTQSVGVYGEKITSIITELEQACFRRVLAGKRVARGLVKKAIFCERVEDCQHECADEKRFACEGFNYRLDPSGRGKGECELLDLPLSHLDIGRDLYPDPDYDYYERDRNAARGNCKGQGNNRYQGYDDYDRRYDLLRPSRPNGYDRWGERDRWQDTRRPYLEDRYDDYDRFRPSGGGGGNRRGDFAYHSSFEHSFNHYNPNYDHKSYEPYLPPRRPPYNEDRRIHKYYVDRDRDSWGIAKPNWGSYGGYYGTNPNPQQFDRKNYYLPPKNTGGGTKDWGQYGGSYGNGGLNLQYNGYGHSQSFDFWGLNKYEEKFHGYGERPPLKRPEKGGGGINYLPAAAPPPKQPPYLPGKPDEFYNSVLPAEPRHPQYDFIKDECSLRSATGFRLHKGIVKKFYAVPNIYECELLCFKEKEFPCSSYAFRYTISLTTPTDNCYLSNRNYKELDFYTDLQPDRDFDIYTMNNQKRCEQPMIRAQDNSECFFRVRSAQRLDYKVVRDSLSVKSIVECQIECLRSTRFTCRAFSFRYGSPVIGGAIDNCQLTDWPFYELDPRIHFISEPGFELYERGSFGHGCEPDHFGIRGRPWRDQKSKSDERCYIGFGSPAKLLRQSTRKTIQVPTEEDCKAECTRLRQKTIFQCMSISYSTSQNSKWEPNCRLSDILQRDLLPNVDYGPEEDSWLFAWDNYNPECRALAENRNKNHLGHGYEGPEDRFGYFGHFPPALDTWRVYSVSGWPCKRGSQCQENREAGFWFCELEGRENHAWDYCCRPDHQCGFSEGFRYPWCYVGPARTQWRKCSDRYYPYGHTYVDRLDQRPPTHYLPEPSFRPPSSYLPDRPAPRPDRPPAPPTHPPPRPSLDEYEMQFDSQFLDPPRPGGFSGQARHWPLSYLHKEMPPNMTEEMRMEMTGVGRNVENPKYAAIQNLINVIKSNDLKNVQYQISNESNKEDDILFVKIPLPTNFTEETTIKTTTKSSSITSVRPNAKNNNNNNTISGPIDVAPNRNNAKRSQKQVNFGGSMTPDRPQPVYRRSYVTRTNVTNHRRANIRTQ